MMSLTPSVPQIAVFDSAFFTTIPTYAYIYALPYEWYQQYGVRRYGFHGTSHLYVSRRAAARLGKSETGANLITLHLGSGSSIAAIKEGKALDCSLGFSTLTGVVMSTRCGDVDPGILLYMIERCGLSVSELSSLLYKQSGLHGITGGVTDRRDILTLIGQGDDRAKLAFDIECYVVKKYIGAYSCALGQVDGIVFTAGVGENAPEYRAEICSGLQVIGASIDHDKNRRAVRGRGEVDISSPDSQVRVFVIPTNEERVFVEDAAAILRGDYQEYSEFNYSFASSEYIPD